MYGYIVWVDPVCKTKEIKVALADWKVIIFNIEKNERTKQSNLTKFMHKNKLLQQYNEFFKR